MGLLGAQHYVKEPVFPLENTVAMINFDMIGWLRNNELTVYNWNTSPQFSEILEDANSGFNFLLKKPTMAFAGSDHLPFNQREVPNMFIHTGTNPVYHKPEDDFEAINCEGALHVIDYAEKVVASIAAMKSRPSFGSPKPVRLGVMVEEVEGEDYLKVVGVSEDSFAAKAGIEKGDFILEADGKAMKVRRYLQVAIQRRSGGILKLKLKSNGKEKEISVDLKKKK